MRNVGGGILPCLAFSAEGSLEAKSCAAGGTPPFANARFTPWTFQMDVCVVMVLVGVGCGLGVGRCGEQVVDYFD